MKIFFKIFILSFFIFCLSGCSQSNLAGGNQEAALDKEPAAGSRLRAADEYPVSSSELVADKLEVYYFHRTARCYSCNLAGAFISGLINEKYKKQIKDGRIIFIELNVELPENREIARKYQATGSSLYFNRIIGGKDNIEQEIRIWRFLGSETQFKKYLEDKINVYLNI